MRKVKDFYIIGIDHGYGNIKTANCCFHTGVVASDTVPTFTGDLLRWNNKYYSIGVGHKEFLGDKFMDNDYYVLTLAAIACELKRERITTAKVFIAAGLPLSWVGRQKRTFIKYLLQNGQLFFSESTISDRDYRSRRVPAGICCNRRTHGAVQRFAYDL